MKLTLQLKLVPTHAQAETLTRTLAATNKACDFISQVAWDSPTFGKFALQKACYQDVRETFGLSAQMTIRALAKVGDAYKLDIKTKRTFRPMSAIAYDDRILSFALPDSSVSIWTLDGRQSIPFVCGASQRALLPFRQGESDLAFVRGKWYLFATISIDDPDMIEVDGVLGIDLGIVTIATDSDAETHTGAIVERVRKQHAGRRAALQSVGTKSAKRRLKKLAGRQKRFQSNENHRISKHVVAKAKHTKRSIALEEVRRDTRFWYHPRRG